MKNISFFLSLLFLGTTFSVCAQQSLSVTYEIPLANKDKNYQLLLSDSLSFFVSCSEEGCPKSIKKLNEETILKSYYNNTIISKSVASSETFVLKDSLSLMTWKLNDINKEVLGYECQEAETTYGGRNYKAYFTYDIPISDGPHKFNGLPGLILKLVSDDGEIKFTATKVEHGEFDYDSSILEKEATHTWEEYVEAFRKDYDELFTYLRSELSVGAKLFFKRIHVEIIYPELQLGKGYGIHTTE